MPTEELESDRRSSAAPASKPVRRRATLQKIGAAIAWVAGVGAILGGLAGYWSTYRTVTTELLASPAPKPMASRFSIAVLPFANLGGDSRQDYVADGITDSLTTDLSHALPGSFVVSRDTAFTYKGRIGDVRQIGRELDVRYALTGSVFPDGGKTSHQRKARRRAGRRPVLGGTIRCRANRPVGSPGRNRRPLGKSHRLEGD